MNKNFNILNPDRAALHEFVSNLNSTNFGKKFKTFKRHIENKPSYEMWLGGDQYFDSLFKYVYASI
jgi:predicted transcriptional regulator